MVIWNFGEWIWYYILLNEMWKLLKEFIYREVMIRKRKGGGGGNEVIFMGRL